MTGLKFIAHQQGEKNGACVNPQSTGLQSLTMSQKKSITHVHSSNRGHFTFKLFSNQICVMLQSPI